MASRTKRAILDSMIKLLNEKPLDQITVRDIVEDCQVSRNTFYYHFEDIPQLLESVINAETERIIQEHVRVDSSADCLEAVISFAMSNRKAALHIYRSANRDIYELYQWRMCRHMATLYIDGVLADRRIAESDHRLLLDYATCLCSGLVSGWLQEGMKSDIRARFHRLCELKQGELERMIERCEKVQEA